MDLWNLVVRALSDTWRLWNGAVRLAPDVRWLLDGPSWVPVLLIAALGGAAGLVGQAVVMSVNRIRGWAQLFSLLASALLVMGSYLVQGLVLWTVGWVVVGDALRPFDVARMVLVSTAPLVFDFLTAIPLLGPAVDVGLSVWSFTIAWAAVAAAYPVGFWGAGLLTGVAWLATLGLYALASPLVAGIRDGLWRRLTGRPLHADSAHLLDLVNVFDEPTSGNAAEGGQPS